MGAESLVKIILSTIGADKAAGDMGRFPVPLPPYPLLSALWLRLPNLHLRHLTNFPHLLHLPEIASLIFIILPCLNLVHCLKSCCPG